MRVAIVGTGYVGLVTGACLAERGHEVTCVDLDPAKVAAISAGRAPFHEAGLPELLARHAGRGLRATTDLAAAVRGSEITLIAVGTPFRGDAIDLSFVEAAAREVGEALRLPEDAEQRTASSEQRSANWHTVVIRSTVVPGTTDGVVLPLLERHSGRRAGESLGVGMNPEFLTEGTAVADFVRQDRIVIGGVDERSRDEIERLYAGFDGVPRVRTNTRTAEMIKYASNALLATAISFTNELANLGAALGGIDTREVMRGVRLSRYLTAQDAVPSGWSAPVASFYEAGCGYGGSCLPKDVKALAAHGRAAGVPMRVLEAVDAVNRDQPARLVALVRKHFPALGGVPVTVLGLAFKPGTDDVRETPARPVVEALLAEGARVTVYDPVAAGTAEGLFGAGRVAVAPDLAAAVRGAKAVVLVTRWPEFDELPALLAPMADAPLVVDGRRMLEKDSVPRYDGIGLGDG
jgi:UDPglucose 6-dehydrogenase/GDP-mannose 6-dehydrogenase